MKPLVLFFANIKRSILATVFFYQINLKIMNNKLTNPTAGLAYI